MKDTEIKTIIAVTGTILFLAMAYMAYESRGRFIESRFGFVGLIITLILAALFWGAAATKDKE